MELGLLMALSPFLFVLGNILIFYIGLTPVVGGLAGILYPFLCAGYVMVMSDSKRYGQIFLAFALLVAVYISTSKSYPLYVTQVCRGKPSANCLSVSSYTSDAATDHYYRRFADREAMSKEADAFGEDIGEGEDHQVLTFIINVIPFGIEWLLSHITPPPVAIMLGVFVEAVFVFVWGAITIAIVQTWLR